MASMVWKMQTRLCRNPAIELGIGLQIDGQWNRVPFDTSTHAAIARQNRLTEFAVMIEHAIFTAIAKLDISYPGSR